MGRDTEFDLTAGGQRRRLLSELDELKKAMCKVKPYFITWGGKVTAFEPVVKDDFAYVTLKIPFEDGGLKGRPSLAKRVVGAKCLVVILPYPVEPKLPFKDIPPRSKRDK